MPPLQSSRVWEKAQDYFDRALERYYSGSLSQWNNEGYFHLHVNNVSS
jgi:hypothetical protein